MKIRTLFIPLKEVSFIKPTGAVKAGWAHRMMYDETEVIEQSAAFIVALDKRLASFTPGLLPYLLHSRGIQGWSITSSSRPLHVNTSFVLGLCKKELVTSRGELLPLEHSLDSVSHSGRCYVRLFQCCGVLR
jgi:hypothetical protein